MNASRSEQSGKGVAREASALRLQVRGVTIAVPPTLSAITTYVLLEQEEWFEKEIRFLRHFLKPGMTAIDIGANLGVYSIPMARLVGPDGRVLSYEPGTEARTLLELSRAWNGFGNLEIIGSALSDRDGDGNLEFAASSELRALGTSRQGERVRITSLDSECAVRAWSSIDFVKIDAEGEEERIIAGGRAFFAAHSPLVMFEIKTGGQPGRASRGNGVRAMKASSRCKSSCSVFKAQEPRSLSHFCLRAQDSTAVAIQGRPANWIAAAAAEQFERTSTFSSFFRGSSPILAWLSQQPFACTEMVRRHTLVAARSGLRPVVPKRLCSETPDHLNAEIWRSGMVPGTVVSA